MTETTEGRPGHAQPAEGREHEGQQSVHLRAEHGLASMYQRFAIPKSHRVKRDATG